MSEIKVNKISPRTNCGTVQLGDSGDTITIPAGATITNNGTQTGFGRTGTVDWQTSIKTATFTAASGEGYFCNTSGGAFTVNLPSSPSVGDIVAIKDYGSSFNTNNLTIARNGSNLNGDAADSTRNTLNESLTLVYADATKGWLSVEEGTGFVGEAFISATGGVVTNSGNCRIHTFTGPGCFTVCAVSSTPTNNVVSYLVIAGGGGGGGICGAGGGGAGGFREYKSPVTPYTASPLNGNPGGTSITVSAQTYPITVGAGGAGGSPPQPTPTNSANGADGGNSVFSTITSTGGGGGSAFVPGVGRDGGSGGGGGGRASKPGGSGNTPPVSPSQGNDGGTTTTSPTNPDRGGGGGGAGAVGGSVGGGSTGAAGGNGVTTCITASPVTRAGGGGGGWDTGTTPAAGGTGGGGNGGYSCGATNQDGAAGTANTGGGGGGAGGNLPSGSSVGGNGGSGIVVIRYKYQ